MVGKAGVRKHRHQSLSDRQRQSLLEAYADGVPVKVLAARFNVSASYPCLLASKYGIARRKMTHTVVEKRPKTAPIASSLPDEIDDIVDPLVAKPSSASVADIRRLHAMGKGRTEIAALLRCKYSEIEAALAA